MSSSISSSRAGWVRRAAAVLLLVVLPFAYLEHWTRNALFAHASYTNSTSLDATLAALRSSDRWTIAIVGDSEVRWGLDAERFDATLAQRGLHARTVNLGIDGFSSSLYFEVLPALALEQYMPRRRLALVGVQLIESHRELAHADLARIMCEGALQKPVFESAFARDTGIARLCDKPAWHDSLVRHASELLATLRYRDQLRSLLVQPARGRQIGFQSTGLPYRPSGYQPHLSIAESRANFQEGWDRVIEESRSGGPAYSPLPPDAWNGVAVVGGVMDIWAARLKALGFVPAFFALPTNPILIDIKNRRDDYLRNSLRMREWAAARGLVYVDAGIPDGLDPDVDFGDHRHLSASGAEKFATTLARELAESPTFRAALSPGS